MFLDHVYDISPKKGVKMVGDMKLFKIFQVVDLVCVVNISRMRGVWIDAVVNAARGTV